ncbi:MAG: type I methionyl aminopeptidase [Candidatus Krumholzibacteria bacterium]|nr:type I methionyl aminopeptidase [Candidatus Krumholzibacteria bacterium]MDP6670025.1 type I methionyl aminopeptidase [Candidatus Krumholzibacteria bacterium]MDP6796646.1 type I methionyl aminopeptidase [Candidatus Krumholzibacteria bacterium]MDP7022052.1 type I methionyl aminopeptidase [Candidatus Krumholzibacteria bacterium]
MIIRKTPEQIEKMNVAGTVLRRSLNAAGEAMAAGVRTRELDELIRGVIEAAGARPAFKGYMGFPANSCISVNEAVVHGIPDDRKLRDGDLVSIDVGVELDGFMADSARTFLLGDVSPENRRLVEVTRRSLEKGLEQCHPGRRVGDISHAVQITVEAHGFSVVRELVGHGIGENLHEDPQIPNFGPPGRGPVLEAGMVFAIEPMVNAGTDRVRTLKDEWTVVTADGKFSAHEEHTVAITEKGPKILTLLD